MDIYESFRTLIWFKFVHKGPINNMPAMVPNRRQAVICNNDGQVYWRTYARPRWSNLAWLHYLQCVSKGDTAVLRRAIDMPWKYPHRAIC